jgi:hypothetical protein
MQDNCGGILCFFTLHLAATPSFYHEKSRLVKEKRKQLLLWKWFPNILTFNSHLEVRLKKNLTEMIEYSTTMFPTGIL